MNMGCPVNGWQMISKNPEATAKFYAEVFGWRIDANNALGYRVVDTCSAEGVGGGIWPAPPGASSFVQLFVEVEDVAAPVLVATKMGATVIVPPQKLPDGEEMAILHDPEGIPFGVTRSGQD
jgi:predicted enzyme related to lactoylglutathione lyase